ncbi:tetratricopeptide repeat protein [Myroides indicus]|uniref:Tetratricopeptide repeat protein n=1 Tax=Myroides indicus TaxID=1323422 RepID=A0A4R7EMH2_9FLAO|nr:tetratricopeptide repeat protein [Myroides indicus]TDS51242.1 tetratricopeptide repeat protein [Myroides indicus]
MKIRKHLLTIIILSTIIAFLLIVILNILYFSNLNLRSKPSTKVENLQFTVIDSLLLIKKFDEAEAKINNLYNDKNTQNPGQLANIYYYKFAIGIYRNKLDNILFFQNKSLDYANLAKDDFTKARIGFLTGRYYLFLSDYVKSLENYLNALVYFESHKEENSYYLWLIYNDLGVFNNEIGDQDKALEYLEKSRHIKNDYTKGEDAIYYGNLGNIYRDSEKSLEKARDNHLLSLKLFEELGERVNIIKALNNMALVESSLENFSSAEMYLNQAEKLIVNSEFSLLSMTTINRANMYLKMSQYEKSREVYLRGYEIAKENNIIKHKLDALAGLYLVFSQLKERDEEYFYIKEYYELKDTINGSKVNQRLEAVRWNNIVKEQKLQYEINQQKQKNILKSYIIAVVSSLLVVTFFWFLYRNKVKSLRISRLENNRLEEKMKAEQELQKAQNEQYEFKVRTRNELQVLKNKQHEIEIESKNKEMIAINVKLLAKNKMLTEIEDILSNRTLGTEKIFRELEKTIRRNKSQEKDWEQFKIIFDKIHPFFFKNLLESYPHLSKTELRVCAYIKINMTNNEMASLLNISHQSLTISRHRIRKKLNLNRSDNLDQIIQSF